MALQGSYVHDAASPPSFAGGGGGNLTGVARKVKDSCADWHNYTLRWANLNAAGSSLIRKISNERLAAARKSVDEEDPSENPDTQAEQDELERRSLLEDACDELQDVYSNLKKTLKKMEAVTGHFEALGKLDDFKRTAARNDERDGSEANRQDLPPHRPNPDATVLFKTWTLYDFHTASVSLLSMFRAELEVKRRVAESVAHVGASRDTLAFLLTAWGRQPYVCTRVVSLGVESMLLETGHR